MKTRISVLFFFWLSCTVVFSQVSNLNESLSLKCLSESKFDSSFFYAEENAAYLRGSSGEHTSAFADALNVLAVSNFYLGNYSKAKYYSYREITLREELKLTRDLKYIRALKNASTICRKSGKYEEALELIRKAEKKAGRTLGKESYEFADILANIACVYTDMGSAVNDMVFLNYADEYFLKAEKIYNSHGNESYSALMVNMSNQASYYNNLGNSPRAENLFQQVISLSEKVYGTENLTYANALNNLGVFYYNSGYYKQAENYFVRAMDVYKKINQEESLQAGICTSNFGSLYNDMGNYNIAEKLLLSAQVIFAAHHQKQSPSYAIVLNNLAMINLSREYYSSTENKNRGKLLKCGQTFLEADSIFGFGISLPQPDGNAIKNNVSLWYKMTGNSKKSLEIMMEQAYQSNLSMKPISMIRKMGLQFRLSVFENQDSYPAIDPVMIPIAAKMVDNMIDDESLRQNSVNQTASTRFLINLIIGKASKVKKTLGPYHPGYALLIRGITPLYKSIGSVAMEEDLTLEYMNIISHNTLQDFTFLSDSEKELYFQTRLPDMDAFTAYALYRKEKNPMITCNAYNFIIQNKGLMLKSSTAMRQAILSSKDEVLLRQYDEWLAMQKEISALYATPVEMRTKDVKSLEARANLLEKDLVKGSQAFGDFRKGAQASWLDVRSSLKPNEAAIEFTHFKVRERDMGDVVYYCALIVRPDSDYPEMVKLFEEKELQAVLGNNQENNINYINSIYGTRKQPDTKLYNLIWQPLESYLSGVTRVYLSPSGLLHKISFTALCNGTDVYLCDKYQLQVKGSTGNVIQKNTLPAGKNLSALVFGGINYNTNKTGTEVWTYLKGTKEEGNTVRNILNNQHVAVSYLSDTKATETFLKENVQNYNLVHIATHGFFFPDPNESRIAAVDEPVEFGEVAFRGGMRGFGVNSFVNSQNPLMRSGLVFAGANDVWNKTKPENTDDGVLTAQEVTQIDMRKNQLVVLSACETGLGDIKGDEGVYGLQRAFKMAGVRYIIMSLWQVPDKETVEFMETFYSKLQQLNDIKEAFTETQKELRQKYDPYYWAAFVLNE